MCFNMNSKNSNKTSSRGVILDELPLIFPYVCIFFNESKNKLPTKQTLMPTTNKMITSSK